MSMSFLLRMLPTKLLSRLLRRPLVELLLNGGPDPAVTVSEEELLDKLEDIFGQGRGVYLAQPATPGSGDSEGDGAGLLCHRLPGAVHPAAHLRPDDEK